MTTDQLEGFDDGEGSLVKLGFQREEQEQTWATTERLLS